MFTSLYVQAETALLAAAPNPGASPPPGVESIANEWIGWLKWVVMALGVAGLIYCGGQMIIGRRNRHATAVDGAVGIPWVIAGLAVIGLAAGIVGQITGV